MCYWHSTSRLVWPPFDGFSTPENFRLMDSQLDGMASWPPFDGFSPHICSFIESNAITIVAAYPQPGSTNELKTGRSPWEGYDKRVVRPYSH